ncbi:protein mono-ADP-ribosyltransferase PARP4, partial [Genypterus blacodes]|uniref:protein mono-ADP-ribosyltransferase PARP4 n=1 Tax=Genypterus blacodes TaxID=154954 RepID=UPI003F769787
LHRASLETHTGTGSQCRVVVISLVFSDTEQERTRLSAVRFWSSQQPADTHCVLCSQACLCLSFTHSVLLELKGLAFEQKKKVKLLVTGNGGQVCFVVNKQCSLIVTSDVSCLSPSRLRGIQKFQTPVVGVDYVYRCVERGALLPVEENRLDLPSSSYSSSSSFLPPHPAATPKQDPSSQQATKTPISKAPADQSKGRAEPVRPANPTPPREEMHQSSRKVLEKFRIYTDADQSLPAYPDTFQVAKYSIFEKVGSLSWCVLELQSAKAEKACQFRVVRHWKDDISAKQGAAVRLVFPFTSEEALEVYQALRDALQEDGLLARSSLPPAAHDLGSAPLQQLLLEEKLNTGSLSPEVGVFVELLWTEALGCLDNILKVSIHDLSLNDVSRAEGLLLQVQRKLAEENLGAASSLLDEVYTLLPHREPRPAASAKLVSQKLDLCQLIRDVLNVSEATLRSPSPSCLGKYRALRCSIETIPPHSSEFELVALLVQRRKLKIKQVLRVSRGAELETFKGELGNIKPLLHSSSPSNFVGILSRGLLLPRVGVEHHGIERTDVGHLGAGIYFSDSLSPSLKYSKPSVTDGSRLLLVCDVALGQCKRVLTRDPTLNQAPQGFSSVQGVRRTRIRTEFEDDEYVVYSPDQVRLKYVVQFSMDEEELKEFSPAVVVSPELCSPPGDQEPGPLQQESIEISPNPLVDVTAGLLDSSGQQLPLQAVHVKCKLMDLLSQVIIFQTYSNLSSVPIEAKYVFPLDDSAAVCGFEAFINGKHVVGQVKEKETARRAYRQAVASGHGAYLMDQDAPDVFTISVGNLPPAATVLIKVTFVSELVVRDGRVFFSLPGSVAPWQRSAALNQTTQVSVEKVCVSDQATNTRDFSLDVSIQMPNQILSLSCLTHRVKTKRTDCQAVVSVLPGEVMGPDGFQLSISLTEIHLPRMWVERHPDKDSQACMLVFYPDFVVPSGSVSDEVVILLDSSESMRGESLRTAQRLALHVLKTLDHSVRVNVICFGTGHRELFLSAQTLGEASQGAATFIKCPSPVGGSTELWRPLRALGLLPPSRGLRNLLLLSDGHVQNAELTLRLVRDQAPHSRLFTCGLSPTANRHMLRALAQAGGGAYEFFDTKTKHSWTEKVARQVNRMASAGCSSASVKWQQFNPAAPPPVQAPAQLHALFSDCHTLVFGFVPHCTQATLHGNLSGRELETMVSTSELQKTKGTFLHKLTARAIIRDYEDGSLDSSEAEHEGKKAQLKDFIVELSREFSILSQFTSFVAVEERLPGQTDQGLTDIPKLIAEEDVDFLPYMSWSSAQEEEEEEEELEKDEDLDFGLFDEISKSVCHIDMEMSRCSGLFDPEDEFGQEETFSGSSGPLSWFSAAAPPPPLPAAPQLDAAVLWESYRSCSLMDTSHTPGGFDLSWLRPAGGFGQPGIRPQLEEVDAPRLSLSSILPIQGEAEENDEYEVTSADKEAAAGVQADLWGLKGLPFPRGSGDRRRLTKFSEEVHMLSTSLSSFYTSHDAAAEGHGGLLERRRRIAPLLFGSSSNFTADEGGAVRNSVDIPLPEDITSTSLACADLDSWGHKQRSTKIMQRSHKGQPAEKQQEQQQEGLSFMISHKKKAKGMAGPHHQGFCSAPPPPRPPPPAHHGPGSAIRALHVQCSQPRPPPPCGFIPTHVIALAPPPSPPAGLGSGPPSPLLGSAPPPPPGLSSGPPPPPPPGLGSGPPPPSPGPGSAPPPPPGLSSGPPPPPPPPGLSSGPPPPPPGLSSGPPPPPPPPGLFSGRPPPPPPGPGTVPPPPGPRSAAPCLGARREVRRARLEEMVDDCTESLSSPRREIQSIKATSSNSSKQIRRLYHEEKLKWRSIFLLQRPEGYWEFSPELEVYLHQDLHYFTTVFLKDKGICSLGVRAHSEILRLVATLLVLQLMRMEKREEGQMLRTLFCMQDAPEPRPVWWAAVKRAVDWVCWADRQHPSIYSRLEFGWSWESSTRQLLGYEIPPPFSPLRALKRPGPPLLIH